MIKGTLSGSSEDAERPNSEMELLEEAAPMSSPTEEPEQMDALEKLTSPSEVKKIIHTLPIDNG